MQTDIWDNLTYVKNHGLYSGLRTTEKSIFKTSEVKKCCGSNFHIRVFNSKIFIFS